MFFRWRVPALPSGSFRAVARNKSRRAHFSSPGARRSPRAASSQLCRVDCRRAHFFLLKKMPRQTCAFVDPISFPIAPTFSFGKRGPFLLRKKRAALTIPLCFINISEATILMPAAPSQKGSLREIIAERIDLLLALSAAALRKKDEKRARRYIYLAKRLSARYNCRFTKAQRALFCKGCGMPSIAGMNTSVRLRKRTKTAEYACSCGRVRRFGY